MIHNNIIYKYQPGVQPGDSTVNQLLEIYNTIISSLDKGQIFDLFFVTSQRHLTKFGIMAFQINFKTMVYVVKSWGGLKTICSIDNKKLK